MSFNYSNEVGGREEVAGLYRDTPLAAYRAVLHIIKIYHLDSFQISDRPTPLILTE
jgi:hypothetical protein